jgi:hypothetical protein
MVRYDKALLDKFCHENEVILETSYDKLNRETIIKGKCKTNGCLNNFSKPFRNLLVSKNFCNQCSLINSRTKCENTNLIKYGCACPLLNDTIKQKKIETCLINYGVENPSQSEVIKNKIKKTNLEKYGVKCSLLNKDIMNKTKETNFKKYGSVHHMSDETIKNKIKDTYCNNCGKNEINIIETPYSFKLLKQEFEAMGIQMRFNCDYVDIPSQFEDIDEEKFKIFRIIQIIT